MVFAVPASKKSLKQNQFLFTVPGDKKRYSIPLAKYLPVGVVEKMSANSGDVTITDLLDLLGQGEAHDAVRSLDQEQLMALMEAWQEESGISVGESSPSAPTS